MSSNGTFSDGGELVVVEDEDRKSVGSRQSELRNTSGQSFSRSERASIEDPVHIPRWISWIDRPFRVKSIVTGRICPEATGWAMDAAARGPLNMVGTYVGVALVALATLDAGCNTVSNCSNLVYGIQPSSMLTLVAAIVGVATALLMPIIGAVVDHTSHRRVIGLVTAVILVIITGIQISIRQSNWLMILILEAVGGFSLLVHVTAVYSYLADLSTHEKDFIQYTSSFNIRQFMMQTVFVGSVLVGSFVSKVPGDLIGNALRTSRIASALAFGISLALLSCAWSFGFRKRQALRQLRSDQSLWTIGFVSVYHTSQEVFTNYRALRWFMLSLLWSPEAGAGVISSIAVTFLQVFMGLTTLQIAVALLLLLFFNLPGSILSKWVCRWLNPLRSYQLANATFAVCGVAAVLILNNPHRHVAFVYVVAAVWGTCMGWIYPSQRVLFCMLIPKTGREFEFMGLFAFFGHILGWLPPVLFTVLNERGASLRWGLALIPIFHSAALACTLFMGDYRVAVDLVSDGLARGASSASSSRGEKGKRRDSSNSEGIDCDRCPPLTTHQLDQTNTGDDVAVMALELSTQNDTLVSMQNDVIVSANGDNVMMVLQQNDCVEQTQDSV